MHEIVEKSVLNPVIFFYLRPVKCWQTFRSATSIWTDLLESVQKVLRLIQSKATSSSAFQCSWILSLASRLMGFVKPKGSSSLAVTWRAFLLVLTGPISFNTLFYRRLVHGPNVISCDFRDSPWQGLGVRHETTRAKEGKSVLKFFHGGPLVHAKSR